MQERRCVQRPAIVPRQMKLLSDLIRDHSDALRVRVLVALELIGRPGELSKSFSRRAIDQLYLDCRHMPEVFATKGTKSTNDKRHAPRLTQSICAFCAFYGYVFNARNSSRALRLFGSAATARSASPCARSFNPRSRYNSASIIRYSAFFGSSLMAALSSVSAARLVASLPASTWP